MPGNCIAAGRHFTGGKPMIGGQPPGCAIQFVDIK